METSNNHEKNVKTTNFHIIVSILYFFVLVILFFLFFMFRDSEWEFNKYSWTLLIGIIVEILILLYLMRSIGLLSFKKDDKRTFLQAIPFYVSYILILIALLSIFNNTLILIPALIIPLIFLILTFLTNREFQFWEKIVHRLALTNFYSLSKINYQKELIQQQKYCTRCRGEQKYPFEFLCSQCRSNILEDDLKTKLCPCLKQNQLFSQCKAVPLGISNLDIFEVKNRCNIESEWLICSRFLNENAKVPDIKEKMPFLTQISETEEIVQREYLRKVLLVFSIFGMIVGLLLPQTQTRIIGGFPSRKIILNSEIKGEFGTFLLLLFILAFLLIILIPSRKDQGLSAIIFGILGMILSLDLLASIDTRMIPSDSWKIYTTENIAIGLILIIMSSILLIIVGISLIREKQCQSFKTQTGY